MKRFLPIIATIPALAACDGPQSVFGANSVEAETVGMLGWIVFAGAGVILLLVIGLTLYAMTMPIDARRWLTNNSFVIGGGIVFPVVTLSVLLIFGLSMTGANSSRGEEPALRIAMTGEQFWWRVAYSPGEAGNAFDSANEIHIPTGRPVEITLRSADVIHSFWVPQLSGKLDMIPGLVNTLIVNARDPGIYRGQCAEYCGAQHAQMAFYVIAHEPAEFEQWLADKSQPAQAAVTDPAGTGADLFISNGCGACHTIRGTQASGTIGPDLTHVGSRHSIGAGILPNSDGAIAAFISSSQHIKPDNLMPSFDTLNEQELQAIAAYLESLQ
jgi:cytochrome c oxidase subunit 2